MKIILLQDIKKLGKKGDVKEVAAGYARNFLLFKGFALIANEQNIARIKKRIRQEQKKKKFKSRDTEMIAQKLKGLEIILQAKAGPDGKLFGSITSEKISEFLSKEKKLKVDKGQIELEEPIKRTGRYPVKINLGRELKVEIGATILPET